MIRLALMAGAVGSLVLARAAIAGQPATADLTPPSPSFYACRRTLMLGHLHRFWRLAVVGGAIGVLLTVSAQASASSKPATGGGASPRYTLIDVGTFGGPQAFLNLPGVPITRRGAVLGTADTTVTDSDFPNFNPFIVGVADPVMAHAFAWQDGRLTDLGALPGNNSSAVFQVNGRGVGAGMSETGELDPITGYPAANAVLFRNGAVTNLGTLPGGQESFALAINDRGQVAGFANNGVRDPVSFFDWGTQTRSFIWQDGVMRDIGTLGGPDAVMNNLNARGQIAGVSYTNATPNPATGAPTTHPFLWTDGHMRDLGTLGGTNSAMDCWCLNDRGEVIGQSSLAGDQITHPFLWEGEHLRDLGTLGGDFGSAHDINHAGNVVGFATLPSNETVHAFLWKRGEMTDLTATGSSQCTLAQAINAHDQIVGGTCGTDTPDALLWDDRQQYDLNTLVAPSDNHLKEAMFISDRGQIVAVGVLPNGNQHIFLLTPTNDEP
jgi:probable HAF family extracellular repeat protein